MSCVKVVGSVLSLTTTTRRERETERGREGNEAYG